MPATPQFDDHVSWLRSLRTQYDSQVVGVERQTSSCPVGFGESSPRTPRTSASSSPRSPLFGASSPDVFSAALPEAPMAWGRAEELNEDAYGYGFGDLSLDESALGEPIYRSIGSMMASAEFVDDPSPYVEDDFGPVMRGFGDSLAASMRDESLDEESESKWLQTMPPLIRRQNACNLAHPPAY